MFGNRKELTSEVRMHSMTLLVIGNKLTGLKRVGSVFNPFLWMEVIFADLYIEGRWTIED